MLILLYYYQTKQIAQRIQQRVLKQRKGVLPRGPAVTPTESAKSTAIEIKDIIFFERCRKEKVLKGSFILQISVSSQYFVSFCADFPDIILHKLNLLQ